MRSAEEMQFFLEKGYLHATSVLTGNDLSRAQAEYDRVWDSEDKPVNQHKLLKHGYFIDLIEHPAILERQRAVFGSQTQLLQYDLLFQGPASTAPQRSWHRDFSFPGDRPLSINTIVYLQDMDDEMGPTRVVPGSHRGTDLPPADHRHEPHPDEVAVDAKAGDAVFINSAIWHSGSCNTSTTRQRRTIYMYYGYWWLKRYESTQQLPWQAIDGASEQRLCLLGLKMPQRDLHIYEPDA